MGRWRWRSQRGSRIIGAGTNKSTSGLLGLVKVVQEYEESHHPVVEHTPTPTTVVRGVMHTPAQMDRDSFTRRDAHGQD